MLISILIANYNNGTFFKDCYESVLAQTYKNWEVIIVDDCSTDDSVDIIQRVIATDSRFVLYKNDKNNGVGYTKKRCVDMAKGDLCAFLDPDDMLEINALELMAGAFKDHPNIVLAHSSFGIYDEKMQFVGKHLHAKPVESKNLFFFNFRGEVTHFSVFNRVAYLSTSGIDTYMRRAADQDLYLKLYEKGDFFFVDAFLYRYRIHEKGISTGITHRNADKALYWHWYACNNAAKRRGIIIENLFLEQFVTKTAYEEVNKKYERITNLLVYKLAKRVKRLFSNK